MISDRPIHKSIDYNLYIKENSLSLFCFIWNLLIKTEESFYISNKNFYGILV